MKQIKLSAHQQLVVDDVERWLKSGTEKQQVYRLFGFAGTGKTTLAQYIAKLAKGKVCYATLSGKAASVLRSKGCEGASTIHSLIYRRVEEKVPIPQTVKEIKDKKPVQFRTVVEWVLRDDPEDKSRSPLCSAALLILDEVSMVNAELAEDLLSFDVPIIALGDPAQLNPPKGTGYFTHEEDPDDSRNLKAVEPDSMLTEIHRQEKGNPIIDMATFVREGGKLTVKDWSEECVVIGKTEGYEKFFHSADQVLCHTNDVRQSINATIRAAKNYKPLPVIGDKLVCLKNDRSNRALLNGTLWIVDEVLRRSSQDPDTGIYVVHSIDDPTLKDVTIRVLDHMFNCDKTREDISDNVSSGGHVFDYGYALTVHKAQGSQWDNVTIFEDFRKRGSEDHRRWLYTGITRAACKVTVIRNIRVL